MQDQSRHYAAPEGLVAALTMIVVREGERRHRRLVGHG
jgi:hypothetical protein